jgi:hypothetical protein
LTSRSRVAPTLRRTAPACPGWSASASSRCSVETYSSFSSHLGLARAEDLHELAGRRARLGAAAAQSGQPVERGAECLAHDGGVDAELAQDGHDDAFVLLE